MPRGNAKGVLLMICLLRKIGNGLFGKVVGGKANHNLILARVRSIRRYPFSHDVWHSDPTVVADSLRRPVAAPVSPDVFKTLCDDVDFAGGWLHERGPAGVEVSRDRRRRQNFKTN